MKEQIIQILQKIKPEIDFTKSENYISSGIFDSIDIITLVSELETAFKISIDGGDIVPENFDSVESMIKLISSKK